MLIQVYLAPWQQEMMLLIVSRVFTSAIDEHANLNTNAKILHSKYHIPLTEARHIIKSYDIYAPLHLHTTISGVNPHGQQPNSL